MTEKTLTTENIKPALDALRGELAPWPVVAKKQDRLNTAQLNAANSGITSSLVAQIIANTAAIRALESAITGTGLRALVVSSLPAIGTQGILYIVPVTTYDPETDADVVNYSNEYIWIPVEGGTASEGHYEQVGQTGIVINNGQLTITVNGTSVGTFTANQSGDTAAAITVPTNADYVDRTTDQTVAGDKTWTGEQSFTLPIVGSIAGTASKAIADEDGNNIKSSYGKLAYVNTWTTAQVFLNNLRFNNTSYVSGTPSENIFYTTLQWGGYVNNTWTAPFTINNAIRTNGYSDTSFRTYSQTSNTLTGFVHETNADASDISFRPIANGTHKLGSSSYQWSSVYAQTYYYNGTQWGLDKANTWSALNSYNQSIQITANFDIGAAPSSEVSGGFNFGNGTSNIGNVTARVNSGGATYSRLYIGNKFANGALDPNGTWKYAELQVGLRANGDRFIYTDGAWRNNLIPYESTLNLGTSTNKWKTLNGINPGALSLPDVATTWEDTTGFVLDGITENLLPLTGNFANPGWVCFRVTHTIGTASFIKVEQSYRLWATSDKDCIDIYTLWVPCKAGTNFSVKCKADSLQVRFHPCLGNV